VRGERQDWKGTLQRCREGFSLGKEERGIGKGALPHSQEGCRGEFPASVRKG